MKYLPVYLFVGFITLILIVLPFIARDESQKIYLPGALEKKLLQKAERIHKKIQAALQTLKTVSYTHLRAHETGRKPSSAHKKPSRATATAPAAKSPTTTTMTAPPFSSTTATSP